MIVIKSFLINEIYDLRDEISSRQLKPQQEKLNQSGNNNICGQDKNIIIENLEIKLDFYQGEKQLLKDEAIAKQRIIETVLYQNNEILNLDQYYNKKAEQETIINKAEEKVNKLNKIIQESIKQVIGLIESIV